MNLDEAQIEFAARGFDYLSDARMTIMLNDGKNAFEDAWEFPWLEMVIQGTAPLIIPDLKYVVVVKAGSEELWGADIRQLVLDGNDLNQTGTPQCWYLSDQVGDRVTLQVWPVATVDLTVVYIRRSPELVNGVDTPLIPARHHSIWLDLAVVEAYHDSDNFSGAQALRADINARLVGVVESYETRNRQHAQPITVRGFNEDD